MQKTLTIKADTAAEASAIYLAKRTAWIARGGWIASGKRPHAFPAGEWNGHHISYNGRVWQKEPTPGYDLRAIYNPGGRTPDIWAKSTA